MLNVGSGQFFTQGNSWATQASVGSVPRKVKFQQLSNGDYTLQCYCWRSSNEQGGYMAENWRNVFFDSETALFVDRNNQANYYFAVEDNGDSFRVSTGKGNSTFSDYYDAGLYMGLKKNSSSTVLSPFVDEDEAYVDWAFVTVEDYEGLEAAVAVYEKAQELYGWIERIEAQNGDASSLSSVYLNEAATMEQLQAAIDSAQPLYIKALINNAPDKENVDVTQALENPDFEQGENGWTVVATAGNGANGHAGNVRPGGSASNQCYEAWNNSSFNIYQTLNGMPVGVYEIEVQGFYRYGRGDNAWNAYLAQNVDYVKPEGVPVYIYMNNSQTNFVNVFGDPTQITTESFYSGGSSDYSKQSNGGTTYYFPNGMASAAIAFSNNMYTQSAFGLIANEGDEFKIGVKGNSSQLNDSWCIWDNFKLYYRGFKADVVKPVLEKAMADVNIYAGMPMGKTVYATMTAALTAAQQAIEQNDGTAMFNALNALYDVQTAVQESKDLFAESGVAEKIVGLEETIANVSESKLSQATLSAANTLLTALKNNTLYENETVGQIAEDVENQIAALNSSVELYTQLKTAIDGLSEDKDAKAYAELLTQATALLTSATTAYNEGTIADADIAEKVTEINTLKSQILASVEKYASLAEAIGRLQTAIAEASSETEHVAQSTLKKANLRLTASQKLYDEGTIADSEIEARIATIDQLITELTKSINLYKDYAAAIANLKTALEKGDKVAAATFTAAQQVYNSATTNYEEGTVDDDAIEAAVNELNTAISSLETSATIYAKYSTAIKNLKTQLDKGEKVAATVLSAAQQLYTTAAKAYEEGSTGDADVDAVITQLNKSVSNLSTSAVQYQRLADATPALEAAVAKKAMQSLLDEANALLTEVKTGYADGSIADDDIETLIETMNAKVAAINASATEYAKLKAAIDRLAAAIEEASAETEHVAASTLQKANLRLTASQKLYDEGTIADADIEARIATIDQLITELTGSINLYKDFVTAIDNLKAAIDGVEGKKLAAATLEAANTLYTMADDAYKEGTIDDDQVAAQINTLNAMINTLNSSVAGYAELNTALEELAGEIGEAVANGVADELINQATGIKEEYQGKYDAGSIADADMADAVARVKGMTAELEADIERILTVVKARMAAAENQGDTYTVGGQKVVGKQKGLVIRNGRKVVVK